MENLGEVLMDCRLLFINQKWIFYCFQIQLKYSFLEFMWSYFSLFNRWSLQWWYSLYRRMFNCTRRFEYFLYLFLSLSTLTSSLTFEIEPGGSRKYPEPEPEPPVRFRVRLVKAKKNGSRFGSKNIFGTRFGTGI